MIYRISFYGPKRGDAHRLFIARLNTTDYTELRSPKRFDNARAHFWFTELGWKNVGKKIYLECIKAKFPVRLHSQKNPKASQVVWQDAYQVALLAKQH